MLPGRSRTEKGCWVHEEHVDLRGKVMIITGANSGIGLEAAVDLARQGATLVVTARDAARLHTAPPCDASSSRQLSTSLITWSSSLATARAAISVHGSTLTCSGETL